MKLEKPLSNFDLETTGVNVVTDRIVQIGVVKVYPNGDIEEKNVLINPTIPIPAEATEVHGISNEDVKDKPTFAQIAKSLHEWLSDSDLCGYNSNSFDVPLLSEEFGRVGIEWPSSDTRFIDVLKIERLVNSHKLDATYKRYTGLDLVGAHDALADVRGTMEVLIGQLSNHDIPTDIAELEAFSMDGKERVDFAGKLTKNEEGVIIFSFGKWSGKPVKEHLDYAKWMLGGEFPRDTKRILKELIDGKKND